MSVDFNDLDSLRREVKRQRAAHKDAAAIYEKEIATLHKALDEAKSSARRSKDALRALERDRLHDAPGRWICVALRTIDEALGWWDAHESELEAQRTCEHGVYELAQGEGGKIEIEGFCAVCDKSSHFEVSLDRDEPSAAGWREQLRCVNCHLYSRQRAVVHFLDTESPSPDGRIYLTEQKTVLFKTLSEIYEDVVGSEFLGDGYDSGETDDEGVRHEDLRRLSFEDEDFDLVATFDVLEHVPDYYAALKECFRVLRPGGRLVLTVPFDRYAEEHLVRAIVREDGEIEHLAEPEYHGDPLRNEGSLAFYLFGWRLLEELREIGFVRVQWHQYWSRENAYLGADQFLLTAEKDGPPRQRSSVRSMLRSKIHVLSDRVARLDADLARYERDLDQSKARHRTMQETYEKEVATLHKALDDLRASMTAEVDRARGEFEEARQEAIPWRSIRSRIAARLRNLLGRTS